MTPDGDPAAAPDRLTVVGSGTLVPSATRACACHLVEVPGAMVLLDLGPGAVHGLARVDKPWWEVTHVVFTHYHADHFADLPHLLFALQWAAPSPRALPLEVIGPPGLKKRAAALRAAHGDFIADPGFPVSYREITRGIPEAAGASLLHFQEVPHADGSVAVRVETARGTAGYTGDTGPDPALADFLAGADVLVAECTHADPPATDRHLSPASVAALAARARPGTLVLTHMRAPLDEASAPALVARAGYDGRVVCARDGDTFQLASRRRVAAGSPDAPTASHAPGRSPQSRTGQARTCSSS